MTKPECAHSTGAFPFLQPHTHAAAVLRNEFDSGIFEGALYGLNSSRRHGPPASLESNNG